MPIMVVFSSLLQDRIWNNSDLCLEEQMREFPHSGSLEGATSGSSK